jgi:y4mF family transcriptional regulator
MTQPPINIQVKNSRRKLGLTQIDFAKRAGVGLRFLRELEGGKTTVRLDKLNQVLDFLGVHIELMRNENINLGLKINI